MPRIKEETMAPPAPGDGVEKNSGPRAKPRFVAYTGKAELPRFTVDSKGGKVKNGEPRYMLAGNRTVGFKLISIQLTPRGCTRKLFRRLKPYPMNRSERGRKDALFMAQLKEMGITPKDG